MAEKSRVSKKQAEMDLIVGVGSQGAAAMIVLAKLMELLVAKGLLRQADVNALVDEAAGVALASPDATNGRFAATAAEHILGLAGRQPRTAN